MTQYVVNEPQAKAINDGASLLIVEIPHTITTIDNGRVEFSTGEWTHNQPYDEYIAQFLPIKQGDNIRIVVGSVNGEDVVIERKVGEVSVKRVQDIFGVEVWKKLRAGKDLNETHILYSPENFINWLKGQGIDYSANPLVALAELKDIG